MDYCTCFIEVFKKRGDYCTTYPVLHFHPPSLFPYFMYILYRTCIHNSMKKNSHNLIKKKIWARKQLCSTCQFCNRKKTKFLLFTLTFTIHPFSSFPAVIFYIYNKAASTTIHSQNIITRNMLFVLSENQTSNDCTILDTQWKCFTGEKKKITTENLQRRSQKPIFIFMHFHLSQLTISKHISLPPPHPSFALPLGYWSE